MIGKKKSSKKQAHLDPSSKARWDAAIADSERLIDEYQAQIELLKSSVRSFKSLRDRGALFPAQTQEVEKVGAV